MKCFVIAIVVVQRYVMVMYSLRPSFILFYDNMSKQMGSFVTLFFRSKIMSMKFLLVMFLIMKAFRIIGLIHLCVGFSDHQSILFLYPATKRLEKIPELSRYIYTDTFMFHKPKLTFILMS